MTHVISFGILFFATLLLSVGAIMKSSVSFVAALLLCCVAIGVFLHAEIKRGRTKPFVTHPPSRESGQHTGLRSRVPDEHAPQVPIDFFDELTTSEAITSLETLSSEELAAVIKRERSGRNRTAVIERARSIIDLTNTPPKADAQQLMVRDPTPVLIERDDHATPRTSTPSLGL